MRNMSKAIAKKGHSMLGATAAAIATIPAVIAAIVAVALPTLS